MKSKITVFVVVLLISLISLSTIFPGYSQAEELSGRGVNLLISGEQEVFSNETNTYEITVDGEFGRNAQNWTLYSRVIEGMASVSPESEESNTSNIFEVEMTAMRKGKVVIEFEAFCSDEDETRRKVETFEVNVLEPSKVIVNVKNPTDTTIENLEVGLFINSELKRIRYIDRLGPNEERRVQFNWSDEDLEPGEHRLEVWVDYGFDESEEFHKDALILEKNIYIPDEGSHILYTSLIILLILGVIGAFLFYLNKKKKRRRPW